MIVVVAEKPSVGRSIARVLGCSQSGEGFTRNNKYIVTWAVGHLVTLQEPDDIDEKYKVWSMETLPILPDTIPLKVISATRGQFKIVKELINNKDTESVICATDAGREGELIFRYIYQQAGCKKPFKRLWISSLTDEAIRDGFAHLAPGSDYDALYRSAKCRSEADWLVGMNATRAFTKRYGTLLSIGRVQTPTLAFLVKRRLEIEHFTPEEYATLVADFGDYKGIMFSEKLKPDTHIATVDQAEKVASIVKGKPATVLSVDTQRKKSLPPQLYDLTSLQRDANRHFGFTADKTLQTAQSLYETHKALTYPRTDSKYLPPDMIPVVADTMKKLPEEYQKYVSKALPDQTTASNKRVIDASKVSDHHAILPTPKQADMSTMNGAEQKLYDLVVRRMLAAFYPPCEYDATKVITKADRFTFRTNGQVIRVPGWKQIGAVAGAKEEAPEQEKGTDDEEVSGILPPLKPGDGRTVIDAIASQKFTKPPAQYTDASLLASMETAGKDSEDEEIAEQMKGHGIGTPATRAAIIERLIAVKYAVRDGKQILATDKGVALIQIMPQEISSAETTGKWEKALDKIAKDTQDPVAFRRSICNFVNFLVDYAKTNTAPFNESAFDDGSKNKPKVQSMEDLVCPVCKKNHVTETQLSFSCADWKNCGFTIWKDTFAKTENVTLTKEMIKTLLTDGKLPLPEDRTLHCNTDYGYLSLYVTHGSTTIQGVGSRITGIISLDNRESYCPHCHKTKVKEYIWGYKCSANCGFTLFKNTFAKSGGPQVISRGMFEDLITEGYTEAVYLGTPERHGVIAIDTENVYWYRTTQDRDACNPEATFSVVKDAVPAKKPAKKKTTTRKRKAKK